VAVVQVQAIGEAMTKFQKVGIAVVAFCLTVAVTRRVQQEIDKQAFQNTPSDEPQIGYWLYEDQLPDGTYGFAHHGPKGITYWTAKPEPNRVNNPLDYLGLKPQKISNKDFTDFNVWSDELVVHREDGPTLYFKIARRVR
jgi:hypothetical protein